MIIELNFRKRDAYGNIMLSDDGMLELLYSGETNINTIVVESSTDSILYNTWAKVFDFKPLQIYYAPPFESIEEFDKKNQAIWHIPHEYQQINLHEFMLTKCNSTVEKDRVKLELKLFQEKNMENVLRVLIYLVDLMRKHNIVWGVGRGSSCASYCLYLIGIHKVNAIKYKLDIKEFLKD